MRLEENQLRKVNMNNIISTLMASSFLMISLSADAETTTGTLNVTAVALGSCSIGSDATLSFGNYDIDSATDTSGNTGTSLQVTCNGGTTWSLYSTESEVTKIMQNTTIATATAMYQLPYTLYTDVAMTIPLAVTNTTGTVNGTGTGLAQTAIIYGKINKGLNVFTGNYAQLINLTLVY
jgi:spore coat protein U-like protein